MMLFLLYLGSLLITGLHCSLYAERRLIENRTMVAGDRMTLVSLGFPVCCVQDFAYYIECITDSCGFNILFIDVDLPEKAAVEVYSGWSSQSDLLAASTLTPSGVWTRPSLIHAAKTLTVILTVPGHPHYYNHSGVKVQVEAFETDATGVTAAVTSIAACGTVNLVRVWKGGEIGLVPNTDKTQPATALDCIWVLKTPSDVNGLNAFARFTYTDKHHVNIEVRAGTSSAAPKISAMKPDDAAAVTMQETEDFSSSDSLYIRVRKRLHTGALRFVYGLYSHRPDGDLISGPCDLIASGGVATPGFRCAESGWCIPAADRCDGINQCRAGEDEARCEETTTLSAATTKAAVTRKSEIEEPSAEGCWTWERKCPDGNCVVLVQRCPGECWQWERKCADGSCKLGMQCPGECRTWERKCQDGTCILGDRCPGECLQFEKRCADGLCIDKLKFCPTETCPSDIPHRCGDRCYGKDERCNQVEFCEDGSDENFCSMPSMWGSTYLRVAIPTMGSIFIVTICVLYALRKRSSPMDGGCPPPPSISSARSRLVEFTGASDSPVITSTRGALTEFTGESDWVTVDATDSPTALLMHLPEAQAPPPYTEAMGATYNPQDPQPSSESQGALPPPYEQVTADCLLPPKSNV